MNSDELFWIKSLESATKKEKPLTLVTLVSFEGVIFTKEIISL